MIPINLYYGNTPNWIPLPEWGNFFLDLGIALANYENTQKRAIVGLALPTLSYTAPLISFGVTVGKCALINPVTEAARRFQQLSTLKNDTPLFYRQNDAKKLTKVFFDGIENKNGETRICLDTKLKGERYCITPQQALRVEFPSTSFDTLPKRPSRRITVSLSQFISDLLNINASAMITSQSSLDTLIIGSLYRLKEELQDRPFAANKDGKFVSGILQDIVRVRRLSKGTETYRSEIYPANSKECENPGQEIPTVVIFDGARSFLRWRNFWRQSHWVVLLDQTETDFEMAVQTFNNEYIMSSILDRQLPGFPLTPTHVPVAMYQEEW